MARAGNKASRLGLTGGELVGFQGGLFENYGAAERAYLENTPLAHRQRLAQFFTPPPIADFMVNWLAEISPETILDPAVGPGIFPDYIHRALPDARLTALDVDAHALSYAKNAGHAAAAEYLNIDFLAFDDARTFDAIVANPPYLRHHDFHYEFNVFDRVGERNQVRLSRLTNLYGLFVFEICRRLNAGGRAAIIIPTEWTNANFGDAMKKFLVERQLLKTIVYFSHESLPFADALTTACVLLIEKSTEGADRVRSIYLEKSIDLSRLPALVQQKPEAADEPAVEGVRVQDIDAKTLLAAKKWDFLLKVGVNPHAAGQGVTLGALAKTKRGIATGANAFFHLPYIEALQLGIQEKHLAPCIAGAGNVVGLDFSAENFEDLVAREKPTHLLVLKDGLNAGEEHYLETGVAEGLPQRYLLAARKRWYEMESRPPAPIWAAVFGRQGLRFVRNSAGVMNLTTFHCIYPLNTDPIFCDALVVVLNSRFIQAKSREQHRVYGGGLLKVEPKDLLDMRVPDFRTARPDMLKILAGYLPVMDRAAKQGVDLPAAVHDKIDALVEMSMGEKSSVRWNQNIGQQFEIEF